jgi:two-component system CheB/CheR fusion protein
MVENTKDFAIMAFDVQRRAIVWNPGAELMFGYKPDEIIGKNAAMIFTAEDRKQGVPEREFETALKQGNAEDERWHRRKDGSRLFVSGVMTLVQNSTGTLLGFAKIARNITPLKHAQEALLEERERAEAKHAATMEHISKISRDMLQPLQDIIDGAGDLAASEPAAQLQAQVERLLHFVSAREQAAKAESAAFSVTALVHEAVKTMEPWARRKELMFSMDTSAVKGMRFQGNVERVREAVLYLCANAIEAAGGGTIHLQVTSQHTDKPGLEDVRLAAELLCLESGKDYKRLKDLAGLLNGALTVTVGETQGCVFMLSLPLILEKR